MNATTLFASFLLSTPSVPSHTIACSFTPHFFYRFPFFSLQKMPLTSKLVKSPRLIILQLLQFLILAISLALFGWTVSYMHCRKTQFQITLPPPQALFMFLIPLCWLFPIYFIITIISPYLLSRRSSLGHRPSWLSSKERYASIFFPALITFLLATYVALPMYTRLLDSSYKFNYGISDDKEPYCNQWHAQPYLALAVSLLVFIETYITYRLDIQLDSLQQQQQPPSATCSKTFCFHKCVSSTIHKNPSAQPPPLASTHCSTVRLLRNIRAVAAIVGIIFLVFAIILLSMTSEFSLPYIPFELSAHIITLFLWILVIVSIIRPTVTRPALDLHPVLRLVFTLFPALALLTWMVNCATVVLNYSCLDEVCTIRTAYSFLGAVFNLSMAIEAIWTFMFDRRRCNTARKVYFWMALQEHTLQQQQQQQMLSDDVGGVELVKFNDGKFLEPVQTDGKIEV